MADIIKPDFMTDRPKDKPRLDTCTGHVPSETPDAPHLRGDNFRPAEGVPFVLVDGDVMARLGLDHISWPGMSGRPGSTAKELKELRERLHSLEEAGGALEIAGRLVKTEARTLARRMTAIIGDRSDPEDFDPRGGAA